MGDVENIYFSSEEYRELVSRYETVLAQLVELEGLVETLTKERTRLEIALANLEMELEDARKPDGSY